ncbi:MAG: hypothetical protein JO171_14740 [Paludibacterium sp.]|uniref:hypothetical protein n=1 Tax=Paludibacterium sp. TaxID=1917523 RepID=UPI0025FA1875|nr:hypothetical protein [Paludibacterium sp.]MBV8048409.1 hypothetical protein [Paludibacterium sp.]MBV8646895.1 hypothetical protein [Paludibacterium sp.]
MRVQSVSYASGAGQSNGRTSSPVHGIASQTGSDASGDLVDLHRASERELAALLSLETLLAIMQGILEDHSGQRLRFEDPRLMADSPYESNDAPAWLAAARHTLTRPASPVLRLTVVGRLTTREGDVQPFALDMQLPAAPVTLTGGGQTGSFVLEHAAGNGQGARVEYALTTFSVWRVTAEASPALPAAAIAPSGVPLFAQFSLGEDPDPLSMAARLLPAERDPALPMRAYGRRDGGYVDMGDPNGSWHQVDISA